MRSRRPRCARRHQRPPPAPARRRPLPARRRRRAASVVRPRTNEPAPSVGSIQATAVRPARVTVTLPSVTPPPRIDDLGGAERAAARCPVQAQSVAGTQRNMLGAVDDRRGPVRSDRHSRDVTRLRRQPLRRTKPPARRTQRRPNRRSQRRPPGQDCITAVSDRGRNGGAARHALHRRHGPWRAEAAAPGSRTAASSRQRPSGRCRNHTTTAAPPRATASAARSLRPPRDTTRGRPTRPRASKPVTRTRRRPETPL